MTAVVRLLAAALLLSACATPRIGPPEPILTEALAPSGLTQDLALSEIVEGEAAGRREALRVEVEADVAANTLNMVGLTALGAPVFAVEVEGATARARVFVPEFPIDPLAILADFQLAHWPADQVARAVRASGHSLKVAPETGMRQIFDRDGAPVADIRYLGPDRRRIVLRRFRPPSEVRIRPADLEAAS